MFPYYFRNDDETPPVWFELMDINSVYILDWDEKEFVSQDGYLAGEYELYDDKFVFASDNVVEVIREEFEQVVAAETLKNPRRLIIVTPCVYNGSDVPKHLHHGWIYEGEQIGNTRFRFPDESGEWHEFQDSNDEQFMNIKHKVKHGGKFQIATSDEIIFRTADELTIYDENGHLRSKNR